MSELIKTELIQSELQKQISSIKVQSHLNPLDIKGIEFLFYAEYDIIYQSFQMKNAAYLQKKLISNSKRQQNEEIKRKYEVLSQKNHNKIIRHDSKIDKYLNRIQFIWHENSIPYFHRYYFEKNINNQMKHYIQSLQTILLNQQKLIKTYSHVVYSLQKAVKAREQCLSLFKIFLSNLKQSDIKQHLYACTQRLYYLRSKKQKIQYQIQGYKINKIMDKKVSKNIFQQTKLQAFGQHFHHLIKLTLHVIQLIQKWKDYLYSLTPDKMKKNQQIDYYYKEENYLLRIINDNNFIQTSFLANFLKFSPKNDPFLLMPVLAIQKYQFQISQKMLNFDKNNDAYHQLIEESNQLKCLKRIFTPKSSSQLLQILSKLRLLVTQYQINIKNRKIFDLKVIHKINNLDLEKAQLKLNSPQKLRLSKSQLKTNTFDQIQNLQESQSTPLKQSNKFRISVSKSQKNLFKSQQILSKGHEFKQNPNLTGSNSNSKQLSKRINLLKLSDSNYVQKDILPRRDSLLSKNYSFMFKNTEVINNSNEKIGSKLMNHKQLQIMKEQLKQKIKLQLNLNDEKKSMRIFQKPQLSEYIEYQVKKTFLKTKFQQQLYRQNSNHAFKGPQIRNKIIKTLSVQTYSIEESQFSSHLKYLYEKQTLFQYEFMQLSKKQLTEGGTFLNHQTRCLEKLPCLYFLKVKQKNYNENHIQEQERQKQHNQSNCQRQNNVFGKYQNLNQSQKYVEVDQISKQYLSNIIFTVKYDQLQVLKYKKHKKVQRVIEILYMTIKSHQLFQLEKIILKTVQFLFKHETADSIVISFYYSQEIPFQTQKIQQLKTILSCSNCLIAQKNIFKKNKKNKNIQNLNKQNQKIKINQVKFHFTRKDSSIYEHSQKYKNHNLYINSNPFSLNVDLHGLLCLQKVKINNGQQTKQNLTKINYDYLLTEILANHLNSDYFLDLRNKAHWQHRLKVIIENIVNLKQNKKNTLKLPFLQILQAQNIYHLNKQLQSQQKKVWSGLDDLLKSNIVKMFSLSLKLSLPYVCKAFINRKGSQIFRFQINSQIDILKMSLNQQAFKDKKMFQSLTCDLILLPSLQKRNIKIGIFDADNIVNLIQMYNKKDNDKQTRKDQLKISDLFNCLSFKKSQIPNKSMKIERSYKKYVRNLFIPMLQSNSSGTQLKYGQSLYPLNCKDLDCIFKSQSHQFIFADELRWKFDTYLENGIRYRSNTQKNDIIFGQNDSFELSKNKKLGIIILLIPQNIILYTRII